MIPTPAPIPVRRIPTPPGDGLTLRTLEEMRRVARRAAADPVIVAAAVDAVRHVDGRDRRALALAIRDWLATRIAFLADPAIDGDVLRTPRHLVGEVALYGRARGDCDDVATLAAALGLAVGLRARYVVLAWGRPGDVRAPWRHVYAELWTGDGWQELDVTAPPELVGRVPIARRMELEV